MQNNVIKGKTVLRREIFYEESKRRLAPKPNIQSKKGEGTYYQLFSKASYVSETKTEKTW